MFPHPSNQHLLYFRMRTVKVCVPFPKPDNFFLSWLCRIVLVFRFTGDCLPIYSVLLLIYIQNLFLYVVVPSLRCHLLGLPFALYFQNLHFTGSCGMNKMPFTWSSSCSISRIFVFIDRFCFYRSETEPQVMIITYLQQLVHWCLDQRNVAILIQIT